MESTAHRACAIVADDDPIVRGALRANLEWRTECDGRTMGVLQADNGQEAVRLASQVQASLVILDIRMPKLDGLAACACIRALAGYETTPIVILTLDGAARTRQCATEAGATMYLVKPFGARTLMLALSKLLPATVLPAKHMSDDNALPDLFRVTG